MNKSMGDLNYNQEAIGCSHYMTHVTPKGLEYLGDIWSYLGDLNYNQEVIECAQYGRRVTTKGLRYSTSDPKQEGN